MPLVKGQPRIFAAQWVYLSGKRLPEPGSWGVGLLTSWSGSFHRPHLETTYVVSFLFCWGPLGLRVPCFPFARTSTHALWFVWNWGSITPTTCLPHSPLGSLWTSSSHCPRPTRLESKNTTGDSVTGSQETAVFPGTGPPLLAPISSIHRQNRQAWAWRGGGGEGGGGGEETADLRWPQNTLHTPLHSPTLTKESNSDPNVTPRILESRNLDSSELKWSCH